MPRVEHSGNKYTASIASIYIYVLAEVNPSNQDSTALYFSANVTYLAAKQSQGTGHFDNISSCDVPKSVFGQQRPDSIPDDLENII